MRRIIKNDLIITDLLEHSTTDNVSLEMSGESDREENAVEDEEDSNSEQAEETMRKTGKQLKKPGRKAKWTQTMLNDIVDIILGNEYYKRKLIFSNVKTQKNGEIYAAILDELKVRCKGRNENVLFSIPQVRSKFKKLISECKHVALTIRTATGIKRFQEGKGYSAWFNKLFEVVKTRDSCSPELAVEPSSTSLKAKNVENTETTESEGTVDEHKDSPVRDFVPVKSAPRKKQKKEDPLVEAIGLMRTAIENDPTKELMKFIQSDIEKSREHELKLFQMLLGQSNPNPQPHFGNHHRDYVVPSVVNPGPSIPRYHFAPQGDDASWDGNPNSFRPVPPVAPSPSFSSASSHTRSSPQSWREGNESHHYLSI